MLLLPRNSFLSMVLMTNKSRYVNISFGQPLRPPASAMGVNEPAWKEEEDRETQSFKDKKTQMEQEVYRMRT